MRLLFGGGPADWAMTSSDASGDAGDGAVFVAPGAEGRFYDAEVGGTRYTDLQTVAGSAISSMVSSDGSDGRARGQVALFQGPDGLLEGMWASWDGGPRVFMPPANLAEVFGPLLTDFGNHVAAVNPHSTGLTDLTDTKNMGAATVGQLLVKQSDGSWAPQTVAGVAGTVQLAGAQQITGTKTYLPGTSSPGWILQGTAPQAANLGEVYCAAADGQGGVAILAVQIGPRGQLTVRPATTGTVAMTLQQLPSQGGNVFEQRNGAGSVIAAMAADGTWRAPNIGRTLPFFKGGPVSIGTGQFSWWNDTGVALVFRSTRLSLMTVNTGADLICDVNINGVSAYGGGSARPKIVAAAVSKTSGAVTPTTVTIPVGAQVTVDIDQVGSTVSGSDLSVGIEVN